MRIQFTEVPPGVRLQRLLAPYNIKLISPYGMVEISRGSISAIHKIRLYPQAKDKSNLLLARLGPFCDFSECALILGGEHTTVPCQFTGAQHIAGVLNAGGVSLQPDTKGPLIVGANCVFSFGSIVLSGATIGENSLIAAGSVVNGKYQPNSIIAGVPGRKIKDRFDTPPNSFWRLNDESICKYFSHNLNEIIDDMYYQDHDNYFVLFGNPDDSGKLGTLEWRGVESNGNFIETSGLAIEFKDYMKQTSNATIIVHDELFRSF